MLPPVKVTKANNKPDYASLITAANLADYGSGGEATPLREKLKACTDATELHGMIAGWPSTQAA